MNYWENGMSWPTENLAATSFNMYSRSGAMATAARRTLACRMPCWVSTAADIAKVDRELWASRQNLMSMIMLGIARIYDLGAAADESGSAVKQVLMQTGQSCHRYNAKCAP